MKLRPLVTLALLVTSALTLAAWVGGRGDAFLVPAAMALVAGTWLGRSARAADLTARILLLGAVVAAFAASWDLQRFSSNWPEYVQEWEVEVRDRLSDELDQLLRQAEAGAERLSREWSGEWGATAPTLPPGLLSTGLEAVAVFDGDGRMLAWDGVHQGPIPPEVRFGQDRYLYREGALFGYLYVTHPLPEGEGTVAVAALLRADLPPGLDEGLTDFTSRFARSHGADLRISRVDRVEGESVWDLRWEDRVLFSVTLDPLSEADQLSRRVGWWQRLVALAIVGAWVVLLRASRGTAVGRIVLAAAAVGFLALLPLGRLLGAPNLYSPTGLLLSIPPGATLGHLLATGGVGLFLLGAVSGVGRGRVPGWLASALAGLAGVGVLHLVSEGASLELLGGEATDWAAFHGAAAVLISFLFILACSIGAGHERRTRPVLLAIGVGGALALAAGALARVDEGSGFPVFAAALWALPLWAVVHALPDDPRWTAGLLRVVIGFTLAASITLPWSWEERVEARKALAEASVERLGTGPDPFLEFLLFRAGDEAVALAGTGRDAVEILYGAWTRSGLAQEDVPVWLTVWTPDGQPREELRIGVAGERPPLPYAFLDMAIQTREVLLSWHDRPDMHYLAAAPLARGALVTAVVPPRRALSARAPLGALFSPARAEPDPLVLLPLLAEETPGPVGEVNWVRSSEGWQGEMYLSYPEGIYHAHYTLALPGIVLMVARGSLLYLLTLLLVLLFWAGGTRAGAEGERGSPGILPWLVSFRGRVTLTLFGFFLLPSLVFGTLAYRTLSGAATRTAETLAQQDVEDAAGWFADVGGSMEFLAARSGSDLLLYDGGELVASSLPELFRLGLYEGWIPAGVHRTLMTGEAVLASTTATLGGWEYVVAFRRMPGGQILAAPAPLQAGATALRQREIADLLAFTVVLGGALSVLLSLLVGRALTRPIQTLRVASERVGAGNMGVHIPEGRGDEFGEVFEAFNRMVDRLGRTRRALIQSSRRTRAIMEEVATGVIALDSGGRVILANQRAEGLFGVPLTRNQSLPAPGESGFDEELAPITEWAAAFLRDRVREAAAEFQVRDRRFRVRARRVGRGRPEGGAVISLEDVTDELRTERILAWGEMARQVAHEVKNPLTPIKLGVQHVRRAWEDGRPDFEEILQRNVKAILREIDRLDAIASGFSRYGAPTMVGSESPEAVDVRAVVEEILTLYQAGSGAIDFSLRCERPLPPATARPSELKEVLVNLLENARAALPSGGDVVIELVEVEGGVRMSVHDDGVGIDPELLPRIFDPHFSTRSAGSGLGLAIVRRLVGSWGGRVWAENRPGGGTTVAVQLERWRSSEASGADAEAVEQ